MSIEQVPNKFASRQVNREFIDGLEVLENKVYPLQGAYGPRPGRDPRLSTFVGAGQDNGMVCYYEHMTTIRHRPTGTFYVVFRETKDAQLAQQSDPVKYPKWLVKDHPQDASAALQRTTTEDIYDEQVFAWVCDERCSLFP